MSFDQCGIMLQGLAIRLLGLGEFALLAQSESEVAMGPGIARPEFDGALMTTDRLIETPLELTEATEIIMGLGMVGVAGQSASFGRCRGSGGCRSWVPSPRSMRTRSASPPVA